MAARAQVRIGKISAETGLSVDAIRFYEKQGLLKHPQRTEGGFRLFDHGDLKRIKLIQRAQKLGFSLAEIRELVILQQDEAGACCHVRDLLEAKLVAVRGKLRQLGTLEQQLKRSLRKCEHKLKGSVDSHRGTCPMLEEIADRELDDN